MKSIYTCVCLLIMLESPAFASDKKATFRGSADEVFNAAQVSAQQSWAIIFSDRASRMMSFATGRSFLSRGMECAVTLHELRDGQVEVVVHTQKKNGQKFAFNAGDRIAQKFFDGIRDGLTKEQASAREPQNATHAGKMLLTGSAELKGSAFASAASVIPALTRLELPEGQP